MGRQGTRQGTLNTFSGTLSLFLGGCLWETWCVYCTDVLSDLGGVGGWSRPDPEQLPDPTKGPDKKMPARGGHLVGGGGLRYCASSSIRSIQYSNISSDVPAHMLSMPRSSSSRSVAPPLVVLNDVSTS